MGVNLWLVKNKNSFFLLGYDNLYYFLTFGTKRNENDCKILLHKWYNHSLSEFHDFNYLHKIANKIYIMDMIKVERINLHVHFNLSKWNMDNFHILSKQLFDYYVESRNNREYSWVDYSKM